MSKRDLQRRLDWLWQRQSPAERGRFLVEAVNDGRLRNGDFGEQEWRDCCVFMESQIPGFTRKMANVPDEVLDAVVAADDDEAREILAAYLEDRWPEPETPTAPARREPEPEPEAQPEPPPEPEPQPMPEPQPLPVLDPPNLTLQYLGPRSFMLKADDDTWNWHIMPGSSRPFPAAEARALAARVPDLEVVE